MKVAHFSHVWNKPGMTSAQRYDQLWQELVLCDELGFDFAFTVEHHFNPNESWMPSPPIYCASAAARTRRLRVGPMGYVAPLYDPLRIAEDAAVLDNILHGRLELGLVSGILPDFFGPFRADFQNRRALTNEGLALLKVALTAEGPFSFEGPFHQYQNVALTVRPLQKPHPPLWIQSRDADTLALLAKEGVHTGYLFFVPRKEAASRYAAYLKLWSQAGHQEKPNIGYWALVYVAETDEEAVRQATPHVVYCFTKVFGTRADGGVPRVNLAEGFAKRGDLGAAEIASHITEVNYLLRHNLAFIGSPDTVAQRVKAAASEGLFNTLLAEFNFGDMGAEDLMRSIRLFGSDVLPSLRSFEPY
jgi:alkanesulfonate monooxygenase SsuD/methylene tetrahydromethanopterin reductase-like flavin-dependent oxidoreductase (luciferase family)